MDELDLHELLITFELWALTHGQKYPEDKQEFFDMIGNENSILKNVHEYFVDADELTEDFQSSVITVLSDIVNGIVKRTPLSRMLSWTDYVGILMPRGIMITHSTDGVVGYLYRKDNGLSFLVIRDIGNEKEVVNNVIKNKDNKEAIIAYMNSLDGDNYS